MIEKIYGKKIDVEKRSESNEKTINYYSFKDVCDLLDIESSNRSNIGRKIKNEVIKVTLKTKNGTTKDRTYCNFEAIVKLCNASKNDNYKKIIKAFKNYESGKISILEKIKRMLGIETKNV